MLWARAVHACHAEPPAAQIDRARGRYRLREEAFTEVLLEAVDIAGSRSAVRQAGMSVMPGQVTSCAGTRLLCGTGGRTHVR